MRELKLYFKYMRMNFLSGLQYKGWPLMMLQVAFNVITDPISLVLMFSRFGNIGPWTVERLILIYAMAITSFGLAESLFRGFDYFPWRMVRTGGFDRLLLRPHSLITQVAASFFHIHRLSRVGVGLCAILWCLWRLGVTATATNVLLIFLALMGGLAAYAGVFIMTSGLSVFTIQGLDWIYIFTNASYQITRCPIDYMPRLLRNIFVFIMPVLVISYYPAAVVCGWGEATWKGFMALPAGLGFLAMSLLVWKVGVRHYKSTGS